MFNWFRRIKTVYVPSARETQLNNELELVKDELKAANVRFNELSAQFAKLELHADGLQNTNNKLIKQLLAFCDSLDRFTDMAKDIVIETNTLLRQSAPLNQPVVFNASNHQPTDYET